MDKIKFINELYYDNELHKSQEFNFELAFLSKGGCSKWKKYLDCQADKEFMGKANNRTIFPNEVVLDYESIEDYNSNLLQVKKDYLYFQTYKSGSRGNHVHLWFDQLLKPNEKLSIITKYGADKQKASKRSMIALEYCKHWKGTGRNKELIEEKRGRNKFITEVKSELDGEGIKKTIQQTFSMPELALSILKVQPLYYDENRLWWAWNKKEWCWKFTDETSILNVVADASYNNTTEGKQKAEIMEALRQASRKNKPEEVSPKWIQFKDNILDTSSGDLFPAASKCFVVNPIPWELDKDLSVDTPIIDRIFEEWVGKEKVRQLHEIVAYCLIPSVPIHRMFYLIGSGSNGKTCFLNLIKKFLGKGNVCSTELELIGKSRFEVAKLHKKLVCIMGETNFNEMHNTPLLKRLTGDDTIGFEFKNKTPFDASNYAKLIVATNNLPATSDKSRGFYRRCLIIDFPNEFSEQIDILATIPDEELKRWALKLSLDILPELLSRRAFMNEGNIEERQRRYEDKSNPMGKFIKENCDVEDPNGDMFTWEFKKRFNDWCKENHFREMNEHSIAKNLKRLGMRASTKRQFIIHDGRDKQLRSWQGIKWIENKK